MSKFAEYYAATGGHESRESALNAFHLSSLGLACVLIPAPITNDRKLLQIAAK